MPSKSSALKRDELLKRAKKAKIVGRHAMRNAELRRSLGMPALKTKKIACFKQESESEPYVGTYKSTSESLKNGRNQRTEYGAMPSEYMDMPADLLAGKPESEYTDMPATNTDDYEIQDMELGQAVLKRQKPNKSGKRVKPNSSKKRK